MKHSVKSNKRTPIFKLVKIGNRFGFYLPVLNRQCIILLGMVIYIVALFPYTKTVQLFDLPKVGEIAKETITTPITFDIVRSPEDVERERKKATDQVLTVVDFKSGGFEKFSKKILDIQKSILTISDESVSDSTKSSIQQLLSRELSFNALSTLQAHPSIFDEVLFCARDLLQTGISAVLLIPSMERLTELRTFYNTSFDQHLLYNHSYVTLRKDSVESTVRVNDIPVKEIALENMIRKLRVEKNLEDEALNTIYELLYTYIKPNITVNDQETIRRRQDAALGVLEISGKVIKDSEIIRKHQEVTPEVIRKLRSLRIALDKMINVREKRKSTINNSGRLLIVLFPLFFIVFYIIHFEKNISENPRYQFALSIILGVQIAVIRGVDLLLPKLFESGSELKLLVPEYLIPLTMGSILTAILFGVRVSFFFTLFVSIFFGCTMGFNQFFFMYSFLCGIVASFSTQNIRYRWHFFKAILPIFFVSAVMITFWHMVSFKLTIYTLITNYGLALISVIVAVFLSMVLITVFEYLFDITTNMTLVELSDLNHPVLKRLSIEAAGTYNHSVLVGNLAESAAQRIGANALFARVASYYHDIGKIEKADYFVENCLSVDRSRHSKLAPSMSALIICSHVKDGVELARKYRVPKSIQDVILQHHGSSMVSFFYEKALEQDPHKQVKEQEFQYAGPPPQTRESAIIMLADSVEAASRSLGTSSPKLLRELVKKIIRDKFLSSQLDQSDLTLKDLDEIVEGFMPVLQGIFHSRIEYPNKDKERNREKERERGTEKE